MGSFSHGSEMPLATTLGAARTYGYMAREATPNNEIAVPLALGMLQKKRCKLKSP